MNGKECKFTSLHPNTLRKYADNNQVECYKTPSGQRKCDRDSLEKFRNPSIVVIEKIFTSTHEFHRKSNWMTFLGKLNTCSPTNLSTLPVCFFQMLRRELISKEKDYKSFWTPAYKELSENLLLPIEIFSVDSVSSPLKSSLKKVVEKLPFMTTKEIKVQNKNSLKTYFILSTSTVANKWEEDVTKPNLLKSLKIKLKINRYQKDTFD